MPEYDWGRKWLDRGEGESKKEEMGEVDGGESAF